MDILNLEGPRSLATELGFGLAPVKEEGKPILYSSDAPKALWPGIQAWWNQIYDEHCMEWGESAYGLGPQSEGGEGAEAPCQGQWSGATLSAASLYVERHPLQAEAGGQALADENIDCGACGMPMWRCSCDFGV